LLQGAASRDALDSIRAPPYRTRTVCRLALYFFGGREASCLLSGYALSACALRAVLSFCGLTAMAVTLQLLQRQHLHCSTAMAAKPSPLQRVGKPWGVESYSAHSRYPFRPFVAAAATAAAAQLQRRQQQQQRREHCKRLSFFCADLISVRWSRCRETL